MKSLSCKNSSFSRSSSQPVLKELDSWNMSLRESSKTGAVIFSSNATKPIYKFTTGHRQLHSRYGSIQRPTDQYICIFQKTHFLCYQSGNISYFCCFCTYFLWLNSPVHVSFWVTLLLFCFIVCTTHFLVCRCNSVNSSVVGPMKDSHVILKLKPISGLYWWIFTPLKTKKQEMFHLFYTFLCWRPLRWQSYDTTVSVEADSFRETAIYTHR